MIISADKKMPNKDQYKLLNLCSYNSCYLYFKKMNLHLSTSGLFDKLCDA